MARRKKTEHLKGCLYCTHFWNACICTDENRALDGDGLKRKLLASRLVAEGNLNVNQYMFQHETKRIRKIDKILATI